MLQDMDIIYCAEKLRNCKFDVIRDHLLFKLRPLSNNLSQKVRLALMRWESDNPGKAKTGMVSLKDTLYYFDYDLLLERVSDSVDLTNEKDFLRIFSAEDLRDFILYVRSSVKKQLDAWCEVVNKI
jgi:hypothetical protein